MIEACLKCIQNLQTSFQKNYHGSKVFANLETKLSANKGLCDLALKSYKNLDDFKDDLGRICTKVSLILNLSNINKIY